MQAPGTHRARFDVTTTVARSSRQPLPTTQCSVADGEEFGVRGRVARAFALVVPPSDHLAVDQHDGADGDVTVDHAPAASSRAIPIAAPSSTASDGNGARLRLRTSAGVRPASLRLAPPHRVQRIASMQ